jgi:hypothetical protein
MQRKQKVFPRGISQIDAPFTAKGKKLFDTERVNSFETDLNRQLQYELFRFRQRTHTAESCRQAAGRQGAAFAAETLDPDPLSASIAGVAAFGTKTVLEGGLIQAASGTFGALGCPPTKRSGWAA